MITSSGKMNTSQAIYAFFAGVCFIIMFAYSEIAIQCARNALALCAKIIIPSLYPFVIISEIIVHSGLGDIIGKPLNKIFNKLFGISSPSVCAVILGALCGFPIGTKVVLSLLDSGSIDKSEAEHLISFCNNPSSSFLINIVGISLYSRSTVGVILYCATLANSALIGIIFNKIKPVKKNEHGYYSRNILSNTSIVTSAVSNSIPSILSICSYIIFFSVIMGCIEKIMSYIHLPKVLAVCVYGLIEMTGGVTHSAALGNNFFGLCLTAFFIGWSGLSVHCQMISLCNRYDLSLKKYFISKALLGFFNSLSVSLIYHINPFLFSPNQSAVSTIYFPDLYDAWAKLCSLLFAIAIAIYIFRIKHKSTICIIY